MHRVKSLLHPCLWHTLTAPLRRPCCDPSLTGQLRVCSSGHIRRLARLSPVDSLLFTVCAVSMGQHLPVRALLRRWMWRLWETGVLGGGEGGRRVWQRLLSREPMAWSPAVFDAPVWNRGSTEKWGEQGRERKRWEKTDPDEEWKRKRLPADQPVFIAEGLEVEGVDVDFDVTPGWRIALIAEGSEEKREVCVRSSEDEMREAGLKLLSCIFLREGLRVAAAVIIWISSVRNVNYTYIT